ncbi:MAG: hypothetical protein KIT81_02370 [Alphaproteobacteria bacterium]|nr:hypothetical protein [Alphaproteobacteria bacterium]
MRRDRAIAIEPELGAILAFALGIALLLAGVAYLFSSTVPDEQVLLNEINGLGYLVALPMSALMAASSRDTRLRRMFWALLAALLAVLAVNEFADDVLLRMEREWADADYDDLVLWILTPIGIYVAGSTRDAPRPARLLLVAGFLFQSCSNLIDLYEVELATLFGIGLEKMLVVTAASEFLFIETYLVGLLWLIVFTVLDPRRAFLRRAEAAAGPVERIHAAHRYYLAERLLAGEKLDRGHLWSLSACWPGLCFGWAALATWRNGRHVRALTGKSCLTQLREQGRLARRHGVAAPWYYAFELHGAERQGRAGAYLTRRVLKAATYRLLRPARARDLSDKLIFQDRCEAAGLPVARLLLACGDGRILRGGVDALAPRVGGIFVKPVRGKGGRGAERWDLLGEGQACDPDGAVADLDQLLARWLCRSRSGALLVQERLVNHPDIAALSNGALATVRLVTCRTEVGDFEAVGAAFRMARGRNRVVDNFHAGGIAAAVDLGSGRLGEATDLGFRPGIGWVREHPDSRAQIAGRLLPCWPETLALARRAHRVFGHRAIVGWDIAITAAGPVLVEGNGAPDLDIIQRTLRQPVGERRLGELLAWNLLQALRARAEPGRASALSDAAACSGRRA